MRIVFAGTPAVALPTLRALVDSRHTVEAVITRPDAPAGRGRRLEESPVATLAQELGIQTLKPGRPNESDFLDQLRAIAPECCPVTAYGALLPQRALDIPVHGWVNLHFSLLPAWRGAAPVQNAILRGDDITGATTFQLVKEMDAGPVYGTLTEPVRPTDTSGDLLDRLAVGGAHLLVTTLDAIEDGTVRAVPQPADGISLAPKLTPDDARVDWKLPAHLIDRQIRACTPDPAPWTLYHPGGRPPVVPRGDDPPYPPHVRAGGHDRKERDLIMPASADEGLPAGSSAVHEGLATEPLDDRPAERLKLWPVTMAAGASMISGGPGLTPGEVLVDRNSVYVGTGTISVRLGDVQPQGKRRMPAADWARGLHAAPGTRLGFE